MEKAVFVACAVFIFYIGYKVPQGFAQVQETVTCSDFNTTEDCCDIKLKGVCMFLNCTGKDNKTHEGCHFQNYTASSVCNDSSAPNICSLSTLAPTTTTTAPDPCQKVSNFTVCCQTKDCVYLNCTKAASSSEYFTGCISNTTEEKNKTCKTGGLQNLCDVPITTTAPTTTAASTKADKTSPSSKATTQSTTGPLKSTPSGQADDGSKQHFDAASFVGGIVLCLGIVAIIFFGCKFYKARTERNYHTL